MTTLIKIKRSSIKKNPDAGRDTYYIPMPWEVTFKTDVRKDSLPEWLQEQSTSWTISDNALCETKGWLNVVDDKLIAFAQSVIKDGHKFEVESKRDFQEIRSMTPEPEYNYKYEDTKVRCKNCKAKVSVNDIDEDEFDGDILFQICPECGAFDTFDYEYEKIKDVMK